MRTVSQAQMLRVPVAGATLNADFVSPVNARGIIVFAHGSGSGRHSHRNQFVARVLQESAFATLLMDLLTEQEERIDNQTRELRFDIDLLAARLSATVQWASQQPMVKDLPIGLFGASTGAAAALSPAAKHPEMVSQWSPAAAAGSGRRLAAERQGAHHADYRRSLRGCPRVESAAQAKMTGDGDVKIVPRATHHFEDLRAGAGRRLCGGLFWRTLKTSASARDSSARATA